MRWSVRRVAFAAIFFFAFGLAIDPGDLASVAGPVAVAVALTTVMDVAAGLFVARLYGYGSEPAADIATTLLARGELALIPAAMAATAGLDPRLAPFIAGYVLVLAVLGPVVARRAHLLARALRTVPALLPAHRTDAPKRNPSPHEDPAPDTTESSAPSTIGAGNAPGSSTVSADAER